MAQATKSPETVKSSAVVKSQIVTKTQEVANFSESLLQTWTEGLDSFYAAQKELEDLFIQTLDNQKDSWGKFNEDLSRIEDEQKKLYENFRETTKSNLSSVFGPSAGKAVDQFYSQFDVVGNYVQDFAFKPYKESLNLISQSQDQFKQSVQNGFEQQQKVREEFKNQIKSTQQMYLDFFEKNTKLFFSVVK